MRERERICGLFARNCAALRRLIFPPEAGKLA
jgi:hypothetical protein